MNKNHKEIMRKDTQMALKHVKGTSASLRINIQIKSTQISFFKYIGKIDK